MASTDEQLRSRIDDERHQLAEALDGLRGEANVGAKLRGDPARCAAWRRTLERTYRPQVRTLDLSRAGELPGALSRPCRRVGEEGKCVPVLLHD